MRHKMNLYVVSFKPVWGVPCALVIKAKNQIECAKIANETITHVEPDESGNRFERIKLVDSNTTGVVIYESGDY